MGTQRLRAIAYEIFKTLNDLNLNFTTKIFHRFLNLTYRKDNLYVHSQSTIKFGKKQNLKVTWGTHMKLIAWKLKINIKSKKSPRKFKHFQILDINAVFAVICKLTKTYYTPVKNNFNLIIVLNTHFNTYHIIANNIHHT